MLNTITAPTATGIKTGPMLVYPARITGIKEEAYAIATYSLAFEDEAMREELSLPRRPVQHALPARHRRSAHLAQFRSRRPSDCWATRFATQAM